MRYFLIICILFYTLFLFGCSEEVTVPVKDLPLKQSTLSKKQTIEKAFDPTLYHEEPQEWGENVTGVRTSFQTSEKEIALTFDACGGDFGSGVDEELLEFLERENIPATLFVNKRWIEENEALFKHLSELDLFQIENHGTKHKPLSVQGGEAWGIEATTSPQEVYEEIMENHEYVASLTGRDMTLFRSGTAFYDEVAVKIAEDIGYEVVNFNVLGDAGATYRKAEVRDALLNAEPGSIILLHMNQPQSATGAGVIEAIPLLQEQGFQFVALHSVDLQ